MEDKRKKLFNDVLGFATKNKEVVKFAQKYPKGYPDWTAANFKDEASVKALFTNITNMGIFEPPFTEKAFFEKFACDLTWAKKLTYCGGSSNTTDSSSNTTGSLFDCLLKDTELKFNKTNNTVYYKGTNDDGSVFYWTFYSNNRFHSSSKMKGSWSCDGTDGYIIILDDKSDTFRWKLNGTNNGWDSSKKTNNTTNTGTSSTTIVDTNLTGDDLAAGKFVKVGMRGDIVTKIQELLIAKGFIHVSKNDKPDGIFGNRTKRMVMAFQAANGLEDDGAVGKDTWPKLNDGSAASNSSTNQATSVKDPFEVPGSDSSIMQESRKKILRKYLQEFK
jgi:hypothetical protein